MNSLSRASDISHSTQLNASGRTPVAASMSQRFIKIAKALQVEINELTVDDEMPELRSLVTRK